MGVRAIQEDMIELRLLRQAKRELDAIDVRTTVPRLAWRISGQSQINAVAEKAATALIRSQWTRLQFKNAAVAIIQQQIDALVAKYPSIDVSD